MLDVQRHPATDRKLSTAYICLAWLHHYTLDPIGKGYLSDRPLSRQQAAWHIDTLATDPTGTKWLHEECARIAPKGDAKSLRGAERVLMEMFAPIVPDGLADEGEKYTHETFTYTYRAGEVRGKPRVDPDVAILATTREQARKTCFKYIRRACLNSERLVDDYALRERDNIRRSGLVLPDGAGECLVVPAEDAADSADGGRQTLVIADESHRMFGSVRETLEVYRANLLKRGGQLVHVTTAYGVGEQSVLEAFCADADAARAGTSPRQSILVHHTKPTSGRHNLETVDGTRAALEEVGEDAPWKRVEPIVDRFTSPGADVPHLQRLWLGIPSTPSTRWLPGDVLVNATANEPTALTPGTMIALGLDASRGHSEGSRDLPDSTALIACVIPADPSTTPYTLTPLRVWEADKPTWRLDFTELDAEVRSAFERFDVVGFYCDPPYIEQFIASWNAEQADELVAGTGRDKISWWTNRDRPMTAALHKIEAALADGDVILDNDPTLVAHCRNAVRRPTQAGYRLGKTSKHSPHKIDAAMAAVLAYLAGADAVSSGCLTPGRGRTTRPAVPVRATVATTY